jgi:hypothetical protein
MNNDDKVQDILNDFFKSATSEQKEELQRMLKARAGSSGLDFGSRTSAKDMALQISRQLGVTSDQIKQSAREIVAQMVLQYDPYISNEKLNLLVDRMVAGEKPRAAVPPELLLEMVSQFTDYSLGRMPQSDHANLPDGWTQKYWEYFPEKIQRLIAAMIKGELPESKFRAAVVREITGG